VVMRREMVFEHLLVEETGVIGTDGDFHAII
jgi:hypothetical protein